MTRDPIPAKLTKNQAVVMAALREANRPMSAYQILDLDGVRAAGLKAPLTIYRALEKLIERGMVHRIETLNAFVVCDHEPHVEPAAFMICNDCKRSIEFPLGGLRRSLARQADACGFEIGDLHVEVSGRCEACSQQGDHCMLDR